MKKKYLISRIIALCSLSTLVVNSLVSCSNKNDSKMNLDPDNPVVISVWHYYNGSILNAFNAMVQDFNDTVGKDQGIIVEGYNYGNVSDLETAVLASANKEVGSQDMPNIFASYADTAYEAEKMDILANLDDYFTDDEKSQYMDSYIEEGKIGLNGEFRIFPIAKSTEVMMLNETDWEPFAQSCGLSFDDLKTIEQLVDVSEKYYKWTDDLTPDISNDGKAFFGRDSMANMFIISSKEFDTEIFKVENGKCTLNINEVVMKKLWDNYYIPYISGYFKSYGKFRSDDTKVGDILAYVGSTSSASYFPNEVTINSETHEIKAKILPAPCFENSKKVMVQQGAGMVVTKSTVEEEYASSVFLKWFTDTDNNILFSSMSGYMPVKKAAVKYDNLKENISKTEFELNEITDTTLEIVLNEIAISELYTNKAFNGGAAARAILENSLQIKAAADREEVVILLEEGKNLAEAVAMYNTEENFQNWLNSFTNELEEAVNQ